MAIGETETTQTPYNEAGVAADGVSATVSDTFTVYGDDYLYDEDYDETYDTFIYDGFPFERNIYLYVWEILVIMTFLFNIVVISVLLRKKMRNATYMILVAISISDSLTGLVTLPTYIGVFGQKPQAMGNEYQALNGSQYVGVLNGSQDVGAQNGSTDVLADSPQDSYYISKEMCDAFMISKFFLSKSFHTMSVWLTLFLGFQRFLSVFSPFQGLARVFTTKVTVSVCVSIFVLAPFLHIYHLFNDKSTVDGICMWKLGRADDCDEDCAYLWLVLLLSHLLPAIFLIVFTIMFIYNLTKTTRRAVGSSRKGSNASITVVNRQRENRRASIVVTAIVIVFLIPEVPYCGFLLYNVISAHTAQNTNLRANRGIHAAYEVLLILSFNANFYIYTFFNRRFRRLLWATLVSPVYTATCGRACPGTCKLEGTFRISSTFSRRSMQNSRSGSAVEMTGLRTMQTQSSSAEESPIIKENPIQSDHSVKI